MLKCLLVASRSDLCHIGPSNISRVQRILAVEGGVKYRLTELTFRRHHLVAKSRNSFR
jgi:hypothetical protein